MPIHSIASFLSSVSDSSSASDTLTFQLRSRLPASLSSTHPFSLLPSTITLTYVHLVFFLIFVFSCWFIKTQWVEGKKSAWERDWTGKMVWVVGEPNGVTLNLLSRLARLPRPPNVLYLPPVESPLPPKLLTILHALNVAARAKTSAGEGGLSLGGENGLGSVGLNTDGLPSSEKQQGGLPLPSNDGKSEWVQVTSEKDGKTETVVRKKKKTTRGKTKNESPPLVMCEPLPRDAREIHEFMKKWLTGGEELRQEEEEIKQKQRQKEGGSGASDRPENKIPEVLQRKQQIRMVDAIIWTDGWEIQRPWFPFTLPGLDYSRPSKSNTTADADKSSSTEWTTEQAQFHLLTAMLPFLLKSPQDRSIRLLSLISPFYSAAIATEASLLERSKKTDEAGRTDATRLMGGPIEGVDSNKIWESPVLDVGKRALKTALVWGHLQKVLDAVATATSEPEAVRVDEAGNPQIDFKDKVDKLKRIEIPSHIKALPVVVSLNRWGVVRSLLGIRGDYPRTSTRGWILYIMLSPWIYLLTPSTEACLEPVMWALSAPATRPTSSSSNTGSETTTLSKDTDKKPADEELHGGKIVRNCECADLPMSLSERSQRGQQLWDELQESVEKVVEELVAEDKKGGNKPRTKSTMRFAKPELESGSEPELVEDDDEDEDEDDDEEDVYA